MEKQSCVEMVHMDGVNKSSKLPNFKNENILIVLQEDQDFNPTTIF